MDNNIQQWITMDNKGQQLTTIANNGRTTMDNMVCDISDVVISTAECRAVLIEEVCSEVQPIPIHPTYSF